ncbi:MAG: hydroxyphenylacetyl-CoA thioesterase PaaI [Beijerinckiaceae bacterium]
MTAMSKEEIARHCAAVMMADDHATQSLGIEIVSVGPGHAIMAMTVTKAMTNGHGTCHGGFLFTLADSAFAFACNSYGPRVVAQHCSITFLSPGRLGMRLTAEAVERQRGERSGISDVTIRSEDGTVIAEFRGNSRTVPGSLLPSA